MYATDADIDVAARTVWGEARNQGAEGMTAVAWVIENRASAPSWWGSDIQSVCLKPYQFSCRNPSDPNLPQLMAVTTDDPQFAEAVQICTDVFAGNVPDPTNGATSYFVTNMTPPPKWSIGKVPCAVIGAHSFYKV